MDVGKPQRIYRVEPLKEPIPAKKDPVEQPPENAPAVPQETPTR